jgi:Ca2+-binding RTX toxin-like protein
MAIDSRALATLTSLAEAAYTRFIRSELNDEAVRIALKTQVAQGGRFVSLQADELVANWRIVEHQPNTASGFSSTLFQSKHNSNEFVLALRGTEGASADLTAADTDIAIDGLAIDQIVDLYNNYGWLKAPAGSVYQAAILQTLADETAAYRNARSNLSPSAFAYIAALRARTDIVIDEPSGSVKRITFADSTLAFSSVDDRARGVGVLPAASKVTAVGHSLGGHLAAAFTRLFPTLQADALSVNGAGYPTGLIGGLSGNAPTNIRNLFGRLGGADRFARHQITNIFGSAGGQFVSMHSEFGLVQQGMHHEIFTESSSWDNAFGHAGGPMSDTAAIHDLFFRIDKSIQRLDVARAVNILRPIFEAAALDDDGSFEAVVNMLGTLLVPGYRPVSGANETRNEELYRAIADVRAVSVSDGRLLPFLGAGSIDPAATAKLDSPAGLAARIALDKLTPFAVEGADYSSLTANGAYTLYNAASDQGELTNRWIEDRSAMMGFLSEFNSGDGAMPVGKQAERYVYEQVGTTAPRSVTVRGRKESASAFPAKVTFATPAADTVLGSDVYVGDRIYAGGGDDVVRAGAGNDYVEGGGGADEIYGDIGDDEILGGEGDDNLYGGGGADKLFGNRGRDILEGNSGRDELHGGAGNDILRGGDQDDMLYGGVGVDVLTGGTGNDELHGGSDADSYLINSGDGNDTIVDTDGLGEIRINNQRLTGGQAKYPGLWQEQAGTERIVYTFSPDAQGRGDLLIQHSTGTTTVKNFKSGELGIVLGAPVPDPRSVPSTTNTLLGTAGNDARLPIPDPLYALLGSAGNDAIKGLAGRDHIRAGSGNDIVEGNAGADLVLGADGNDMVFGDNFMTPAELDAYIIASATAPTAGTMPARLLASDGDWLEGSWGNDIVVGGSTNDVIFGGAGKDELIGGAGHDIINGDDDYEVANLVTGFAEPGGPGDPFSAYYEPVWVWNWYSEYPGDADTIHAGSGDDLILGLYGDDEIWGDDGNDIASGNAGADKIFGGRGDDRLTGDDYGMRSGPDMTTSVGDDYIDGGEGNDVLYGDGGEDVLLGGPGNDRIYGYNPFLDGIEDDGGDFIDGGDGADLLYGDAGADRIAGGNGDDTLYGEFSHTPVGLHAGDYLDGGSGNDILLGYGGDDTLIGGEGADWMSGGDGDDYIDAADGEGDDLTTIDQALGEAGNDIMVGAPGHTVWFWGGAGNDSLSGTGQLFGEDGDDLLVTQGVHGPTSSKSYLRGGAGDDSLFVLHGAASAYGDEGNDKLYGGDGTSALSGGAGNDVIIGGEGIEIAFGGADEDVLYGDGGDDLLFGEDASDELYGGAGDDFVSGGDGDDTLEGGTGRNYLAGDGGADTYLRDDTGAHDFIDDTADGNTLTFGEGIDGDRLIFRSGEDASGQPSYLIIEGFAAGGSVTIAGGMNGTVSSFIFDDGTTLTAQEARDRALAYVGPPVLVTPPALDLAGSDGDDTIVATSAEQTTYGGEGNDTLIGGAANDTLRGGPGGDRLVGGGGRNQLEGGDGEDTYVIGTIDDGTTIAEERRGGAEIDTIEFKPGVTPATTRLIRDGNNLLVLMQGGAAQVTVAKYFIVSDSGGPLDAKIEVMKFADGTVWDAAAIGSRIEAGSPNAMTGTAADDTFVVDSDLDTVTEAANGGTDTIQSSVSYRLPANVERLVLTGPANLKAWGHASNPTSWLYGNDGDNVFNEGGNSGGYAVMAGGKGDDTYYYDYTKWGLAVENANEGIDTIVVPRGAGYFVLPPNIENLIDESGYLDGGRGIDTLIGNDADNVLGHTTRYPGHIPYYIDGGLGADTMYGGVETDVYVVDNVRDRVIEPDVPEGAVQSYSDEVRSSVTYELPRFVERLTLIGSDAIDGRGNALDNVLDGTQNAAVNRLRGGFGDDTYRYDGVDIVEELPDQGNDTLEFTGTVTRVYTADELPANVEWLALHDDVGASGLQGSDGDEHLTGNASDNVITGGGGDDVLGGGDGNDTLDGGAGNDELGGGAGEDTFLFTQGFGSDVLTDAVGIGSVDHIVFDSTISRDDVYFDEGHLRIAGASDRIRIADRYTGTDPQHGAAALRGAVDVRFADGSAISHAQVVAALNASFSKTPSSGADTLVGTPGDDTLSALAGADFLYGLAGNDTLAGGDGADWLYGGDGADIVTGDAGADLLRGGAGNDQLDGGADNDTIDGGDGHDVLLGGDGADVLNGGRGNDNIDGGADADVLHGHEDDDILAGGAGADTLYGDDGNDTLDGGEGRDTLYGGAGNDRLTGSDGDDTLSGEAGDDILDGGAGNDFIVDEYGNNTLIGGAGMDTLQALDGNDTLDGGTGFDVLIGGGGTDTYVLRRGGESEWIGEQWGNGDRTIIAVEPGVTPAELSLARLNDVDFGDYLAVTIAGSADELKLSQIDIAIPSLEIRFADGTVWNSATINDKLYLRQGTAGDDVLTGSSGNDRLYGYAGNDTLSGLEGDDLLDGGTGSDAMAGGPGSDSYVVDSAGDVVTEAANAGHDSVTASLSYTLPLNVEDLVLTGSAANGTGNALDNRITGNAAGNVLDGKAGRDTMIGGAGNDTYVVDNTGDIVTENANEGTDLVQSSVTYTLAATLENLTLTGSSSINGTGNAGNNVIVGNAAANILTGGAGDDQLNGAAGADTLRGNAGSDTYTVDNAGDIVTEAANEGTDVVLSSVTYTLTANVENLTLTGAAAINGTGNTLNNTLTGNASANTLNGGTGADILIGGAGNDTYVVDNVGDIVTEAAGQGTDLVQSSVTYTLAAEVENLTLTGASAINGTGNSLANVIIGNTANNALDGGAGADSLRGGAGNDTYIVDNATDTIVENAGEGTDLVNASVSHVLAANVENLTLTGSSAINGTGNTLANTLLGNAANNTLDGGTGSDTMRGGAGNDTYVVDAATDVVVENASEGVDLIQSAVTWALGANVENLTLTGSAAINGTGNALVNAITGNSANNTLDGGAGADTMIGGAGNDTYVVDNAGDVVTEAASAGTDHVNASVTYSLGANVENLTLIGSAAINGTGNSLANVINGNAANNTLDGGAGADTMIGGMGNDTYVVDNVGDVVTEALSSGIDTVNASITYVTAANVEFLTLTGASAINGTGNALDNWLRGNGAVNSLSGMDGHDTLWGDLGNDVLNGNNGNDLLQGGGGNDALTDTAGNNLLDGGAGTDTLTGGAAREMLIGGSGNDTLTTGGGADVIGFNKGDGADIVNASTGSDDTLSLGGGLAYGDLKLRKTGLDLILDASNGDQITFRNWYQTGINNKSVLNLQVVADAMAAYNPSGSDPLLNKKLVRFNFGGIVSAFDAALVADPGITSWNVTNALAANYVAGSDTAAIGGDFAYDFGHRNALTNIGATPAQSVLASASFGTAAQTLQSAATLYAGTVRLN